MTDGRNIFLSELSHNFEPDTHSVNSSESHGTSSADNKNFVLNDITSKSFALNPDFVQITAKIDSLKKWTVNTYKTTKQSFNEHLGKVKKSVDKDLEERIDALRELHRQYCEILTLTWSYTKHVIQTNKLQKSLAETFYQLSCKEEILNNEFAFHSEALRNMSQNGEIFIQTFNIFISALETLTNKTIEDTLLTISHHDQARLEFDVYRNELEQLRLNPNAKTNENTLSEKEKICDEYRLKYEQLKEDVRVKITLLQENRCKVLREQLALIQKSFLVLFSNNTNALKGIVDELNSTNNAHLNLYENDPMKPSLMMQNLN